MADSRSKNSIRNIAYGIVNKIVTLILPFITRTVILYFLSIEYLGLGSLFSSILSFLSLTELGIGSAIVFHMYKPIADGNIEEINALLRYYRDLYRKIGCAVLFIGTIISFFLTRIIKTESVPPDINIFILYFIYLLTSVVSYFFAGYRQSLLQAHQRADIISKISLLVNICVRIIEIIVLIIFGSFYIYAIIPFFGTIITNLITSLVTRRMYPEILCEGNVSRRIKDNIKKETIGLFGTKLNSIVVNSADTIVISAFLGLRMVGIYSNYYYVINSVGGFVLILFSSLTASIGNKLAVDSIEDSYSLFNHISFINMWLVGWATTCIACLIQPFMKLWVGERYSLDLGFALLISLYFYIYQVQRTVLVFKDAGGLWYQDRMRPYISMLINLACNIVLVQLIGIYGIVISTIISFAISVPWANYVLFRYLFKKDAKDNIGRIIKNLMITIVAIIITFFTCYFVSYSVIGFIIRMIICIIAPNMVLYVAYRKNNDYRYWIYKISERIIK